MIHVYDSKPSQQAGAILAVVPTTTSSFTETLTIIETPTLAPYSPPSSQVTNSVCDRLYQVSLNYLADTDETADRIAREIAFLGGKNESADLVCGPLSISIMKDAGILPSNTSTLDIWLLCPREEREECHGIKILNNEYFPSQDYDYYRVYESVRTFDFTSNPLLPGDWLYLYTSNNGFDHMLVVTRVDKNRVPYTVTNLNRGKGFVISEEVLYDPNMPGIGLFYELTNPSRGTLGMMGTGGFLLVRRKDGLCNGPTEFDINQEVRWEIEQETK